MTKLNSTANVTKTNSKSSGYDHNKITLWNIGSFTPEEINVFVGSLLIIPYLVLFIWWCKAKVFKV